MTNTNTALLSSASPVRAPRLCTCGCGAPTARTFAPGHDAKLKSEIRAIVAGRAEIRVLSHTAIAYGAQWEALPADLRTAFAKIAWRKGPEAVRHAAARRGRLGV